MANFYKVYHTTQFRGNTLIAPIFAEGPKNWFGDGFYFWKDYEFAEYWGHNRSCKQKQNIDKKFDVYTAEIKIENTDNIIDTVFDETDYYNFLESVEFFALRFHSLFKKKPSLEEFNDFIKDFKIWGDIQVIRFQDLPTKASSEYLKITGFYYKKRIVYVVFDLNIIHKFARLKTISCN